MADQRPAGRTTIDLLLVFFLGAVVGLLTSFSIFSGRLATIEANQSANQINMARLEAAMSRLESRAAIGSRP